MAVIKAYREAEARVAAGGSADVAAPEWEEMMKGLDEEDPKGRGTGKRRKIQGNDDGVSNGSIGDHELVVGDGDEQLKDKVKRRRVSRKKSDQTVGEDGDSSYGGEGASRTGSEIPEKPKKARKARVPKASKSLDTVAGELSRNPIGSTSRSMDETAAMAQAQELPSAEVLLPKSGLRGSSTGIVGSGKRKKAALTAWRNSTRAKDLAPG
jgi:hypothetical protein